MSKDSPPLEEILSLPTADLLLPPDGLLGRYTSPGRRNSNGEYEGTILTSPVTGGKRLQACSLVFDDGESVLISYRPNPEYFQFERKRVLVRGDMHNPALDFPDRQAVMGWHIDISSIRLADDEAPYDPLPTSLPPPVRIDSLSALQACTDKYVRVVGALQGGAIAGPHRASLQLALTDGLLSLDRVRLGNSGSYFVRDLLRRPRVSQDSPPAPVGSNADPAPHSEPQELEFGDTITVIVSKYSKGLSGVSVCPGDVEYCGCGLQDAKTRKKKRFKS